MSATVAPETRRHPPHRWAIAWSSSDKPSRTEPSAARAIMVERRRCHLHRLGLGDAGEVPVSSASGMRRRSKRWQRDSTVTGTLRISVVAKTNLTCGGGSSSVFSSALKALRDSMCTSSMMKTLVRACSGRKRVASMISRTSSTPVLLAASISTTSGWRSARMAMQLSHTPQGSGVGPPVPSGPCSSGRGR